MDRSLRTAFTLVLVFAFSGCREDPPEVPQPDEEKPAAIPAQAGGGEPVTLRRPKIPDDIFFDDPLAVARIGEGTEQAAPQNELAAVTTDLMAEPATHAEGEKAPEAVDWAALLPAEALTAEVERIRERFEPKLASVASFNNSLLDFPPYAAELAALGAIAAEHAGGVPWKVNAKHVRDLAGAMTAEQLQRGQKSYEQVKEPFEKVATILGGKTPDGLPEADDETDYAVAVDFGYLMRRFEAGQNTVQTTGSSEAGFKKNAADLAREMRVTAALSKLVALDDYGYGDDAKFQGFAGAMTKAALDAAVAAEAGDFGAFNASVNALGQSCTQCHGEYRNN